MSYVAPDTPPAPEFPERPEAAAPPPKPQGAAAWPAWTAPVALVTALIASLLAGLLVGVIAQIGGAEVFVEGQDPPPGVVVAGLFAQGLVFVATPILLARLHAPAGPRDFGLRATRVWRAIGITVAAYIAFAIAAQLWFELVGMPGDERVLDSLGVDRSTLLMVLGAFSVCVLAPLGEEFLFRGFMFPALRNSLGVAGAAVMTGVLFGLVHAFSSDVEALVPLAALGAVFCLIYQWTGSLYPCIALHAINNSIAFGGEQDWDWQIAALALGAVAVCFAVASGAARLWRPSPA